MKILTVLFVFISTCSFAQLQTQDSVFVELNKLGAEKIYYGLQGNKINVIVVSVKSKYQDQLGFIASYSNSNLYLKKRENIPLEKVLSYEKFNELLNDDFLKIHYYYKIYFVISEDRDNYLVLDVRPITPPYFNRE